MVNTFLARIFEKHLLNSVNNTCKFNAKMKSKNPIWEYFEKDASTAKCKICLRSLSLGSILPKKQTIANIKNHLQRLHKDQWKKYMETQEEPVEVPKHKKSKNNKKTLKVSLQSEDIVEPTQTNLPLVRSDTKQQTFWPDDHPISLSIDKSIMDMIIVDMLPYSIVEGEGFKRLNFADPNEACHYRKKSEKYFRTSMMPATYEKVKQKVLELLSKASCISITTNIWSNPSKTWSLLGVTAHFIDGPNRPKVVLGAMVLNEDQSGLFIAQKLTEIIDKFAISSKIHLAICDNAANMGSAMRIGNFQTIGCVSQTLQFVINDAIFQNDRVNFIIKKCRKIVSHFKKNEQANRYLKQFQETCRLPGNCLIADVETNWTSTYLMMERLFEQKVAVNMYLTECGGIDVPTAEEWTHVHHLVSLLSCFYQAILDISSESACVSIVIPLIAMLKTTLQSPADSPVVSALQNRLWEAVNERFAYVRNYSPLTVATMMDPRFKAKYLTSEEIMNSRVEIGNFLCQEFLSCAVSDECVHSTPVSLAPQPVRQRNLWDSHDGVSVPSAMQVPVEACNSNFSRIEENLDSYLREPLVNRNADIYQYWDSSPYLYLRKVASKYLSAPTTSVASEQLFSSARQIYADKRSNLLGENANKLLFLAYNIKLFNFDY